MAKTAPKKYKLLDGRHVDPASFDARGVAFLADLQAMVRKNINYFEVYRAAVGPGSVALGGRNRIDRKIAESPVYLVAVDLATRAGIKQGLILAPEHEHERRQARVDSSMISVAQAADLVGVSRAAIYKAIDRSALTVERIGNVTVVNRDSAIAYKERRATPESLNSGKRSTRAGSPANGKRSTRAAEKSRATR